MHRHVLANNRAKPDLESRRLAIECLMLRLTPQASMRKDARLRADPRSPDQRRVGSDLDAGAELHLSPNEDKWADDDVRRENRTVFDEGRGMNLRHAISPYD